MKESTMKLIAMLVFVGIGCAIIGFGLALAIFAEFLMKLMGVIAMLTVGPLAIAVGTEYYDEYKESKKAEQKENEEV